MTEIKQPAPKPLPADMEVGVHTVADHPFEVWKLLGKSTTIDGKREYKYSIARMHVPIGAKIIRPTEPCWHDKPRHVYGHTCPPSDDFRTDQLVVVEIIAGSRDQCSSGFGPVFTEMEYRVGATVIEPKLDMRDWLVCTSGLHFVRTREEAEGLISRYGMNTIFCVPPVEAPSARQHWAPPACQKK